MRSSGDKPNAYMAIMAEIRLVVTVIINRKKEGSIIHTITIGAMIAKAVDNIILTTTSLKKLIIG